MTEVLVWAALSLLAFVFIVLPALSYLLWTRSSQEAKEIGAQMDKRGHDSGFAAFIADQVLAEIPDAEQEGRNDER